MGMFDYINYNGHEYQTKDTPEQGMETYEIRGDELWYKQVEREWVENENDNSFLPGYLQEVSHEWKFCKNFDGLIRFYREDLDSGGYKNDAWIKYKALFMDGKIIKLEEIKDE
jgi:hypothetical protein